jgi:GNAT superfamily N-acetyltransferase
MAPERGRFEEDHRIEIKTSPDEEMLRAASLLVSEHSWGPDYPIHPIDEIQKAEFCVGAYAADKLVGFAAVAHNASPDGLDMDGLWLGYAVVVPEFRQQGIFRKLYETCMAYITTVPGRVLACTDNLTVELFLLDNGWRFVRKTNDESGADSIVFEYERR